MYIGECIPVNIHLDSLSNAEVRWWYKQLRCNTIPRSRNKNTSPVRSAIMMSSLLHQSRQGCPMLESSKNPIYIHTRLLNSWGKPQLESYMHTSVLPQGETILSKTKQEHDLPEVATPVVKVVVSGL